MSLLMNDLSKGAWSMSLEGIAFWAPIASKILAGEKFTLDLGIGPLMLVYDKNNKLVHPDEDGNIDIPKGSVAVINMVGPLVRHGGLCIYGADDIVNALNRVEAHPNLIGAVSYLDGPGGGVNAISPFIQFGKTRKKPYVGLYEECCSAHLYSMLQYTDHVMAENNLSAMIGSCGIVFSCRDDRGALQELGFKFHEVYPDESKDKNLAFRLMLEGKYDMIKKEMLSPLAVKFQDAFVAARPRLEKDFPGVLTGKTFFTDQAIELGITDSMGTMEDALDRVRMLSEMRSL